MKQVVVTFLLSCIVLLFFMLLMSDKSTWNVVWYGYLLIAALLGMFIAVEYYWFHSFFRRHSQKIIALSIGYIGVGINIHALSIGTSEQFYPSGTAPAYGRAVYWKVIIDYLGVHFGPWAAALIETGIGLSLLLWPIWHWKNESQGSG